MQVLCRENRLQDGDHFATGDEQGQQRLQGAPGPAAAAAAATAVAAAGWEGGWMESCSGWMDGWDWVDGVRGWTNGGWLEVWGG